MAKPTIILASSSPFRRQLLENAGLSFACHSASIDERAAEETFLRENTEIARPQDLALHLAKLKARDVSTRHPQALVIGCDQVLSLEGEVLHKCASLEELKERLLKLSARIHFLDSAVAIAREGRAVWSGVSRASMTMRALSPDFIAGYLERVGPDVLASVGGYQIEGEGVHLFESVVGDHFTIVGLPLLPLLEALRRLGAIDA